MRRRSSPGSWIRPRARCSTSPTCWRARTGGASRSSPSSARSRRRLQPGRHWCRCSPASPPASAGSTRSEYGRRSRSSARRASRPPADHVLVRDRADQARASSRLEPGRDRERTQHGPHSHRAGRPSLVPGHRPLHAHARTVTLWLCRVVRSVRPDGDPADGWPSCSAQGLSLPAGSTIVRAVAPDNREGG